VGLVIHADPPVEHKAYLHRSGRTARAGASGSVITLMMDDQVRDVRDLTRKAGINPKTTRAHATHPILGEIAPGERTFPGGYAPVASASAAQSTSGGGRRRQGGSGRSGQARSGQARSGQGSGQGQSRSGGNRAQGRPARSGGGAAAFSAGSRSGRR
jgi:superfamily II DNA/RNA helicase